MDKKEMIERYDMLFEKMSLSNEPQNMMIFGNAEKSIFHLIAESHPDVAQIWLNKIEAINWYNYLCDGEAEKISKTIENQDGSKGFHWDYQTFVNAVKSNSLMLEYVPYYNSYALWVTANMIYSDHAISIAADLGYEKLADAPGERIFLSCYKKAVEKLMDKDRMRFIRAYFADAIK